MRRRVLLLIAAMLAAAAVTSALAFARGTASIGTGVVTVTTRQSYEGTAAAGTGMVLTSTGEVLTNNHVISGATSIVVAVPGTGHLYAARVVGYDVRDDVALLQLAGASNLKTVLVSPARAGLGQHVHAVGNAGGSGTLIRVAGRITGTGKTITAADDQGNTEKLVGLLETDANVVPGDSGGPLLDSAEHVVGMVTAASTNGAFRFENASISDAYAIPIAKAITVAAAIAAGQSSTAVHIGPTAFLGVQLSTGTAGGAVIATVVPGGPADKAGLAEGDLIDAIDGHTITSSTQVGNVVLTKLPGQTVRVRYLDSAGSHTVSVKLASGPPR